MEIYNGQLACTAEEIGVPVKTIAQMVYRYPSLRLRRACKGTQALYSVDALPMKYKNALFKDAQPPAPAPREGYTFTDRIVEDVRALRFYSNYVLEDGRHLSPDKVRQYSNSAAILNTFAQVIDEANAMRMKQDGKKLSITEFWQKASEALPKIAEIYSHTLPGNARELQRKYNAYTPDNYGALISGRYGTENSNKVKTDEQKALLTLLLSHHNNFDNQRIADLYNQEAQRNQWPTISANTVANFKKKVDLTISASRLGETNFRNTRSMTVQRTKPSTPFLFWSADGWDCELYYQGTTVDAKGTRTIYHQRLVVEVVLDPCVNYVIGYAVGYRESKELIREALKNAVLHGRELTGELLMTCQLQTDHFGTGKDMAPFISAVADKFTPARVKNAKAKPVEPFFNYLNREYCQTQMNWSGFGITSDPLKQPNSEALNLYKKEFPDEAGVRAQIDAIIAADRAKKRAEFLRLYADLKEENRHRVSRESYLQYFGTQSDYLYSLSKTGINMKVLGERYQFDSFDITFREHKDLRWRLSYDIEDLSTILAESEDGQYRYILDKKYVQPMALADRTDGDAEQLQKVRDFNKELEAHVTEQLAETYDKAETVISNSPQLRNILRRALITDSRGQHKTLKEADMNTTAPATEQEPETKQDYSIF
ncbi:MAG: hypothetical protein MJZ66_10845 [Bacteroidales bacterium]|nr:hypothetical protein [Bacteroidales bacterium]